MKELLHTPIFNVVELDEVEKGFKPIGVNAPDWVTVIVEKGDKFLVVEQVRFGTMKKTVEFPSGTVEKDEDARTAAARELFEETGIIVDPDKLDGLLVCSPNPAFMMNKKFIYYVNLDKTNYTQTEQHLDKHEHITFKWVDKYVLMDNFCNPWIDGGEKPAMFATALFAYWNRKGLFNKLKGIKECLM